MSAKQVPKAIVTTVSPRIDQIKNLIDEFDKSPMYFLLVSSKSEATPDSLEAEYKQGFSYETEFIEDGFDLDACYQASHRILRRALAAAEGDGNNLFIDFTGGTAAMSVGLCLAAGNLGLETIYQESEQLPDGPVRFKRWRSFKDVGAIWALFEAGVRFFNATGYEAALDAFTQAKDAGTLEPAMSRLKKLVRLAEGFAAWDIGQYKKAYSELGKFRRELQKSDKAWLPGIDAQIDDWAGWIRSLRDFPRSKQAENLKIPNKEFPGDMLARARNRLERNNTDDAMISVYRMCEAVVQCEFANETGGYSTTGVPAGITESVTWMMGMPRRNRSDSFDLGFHKALEFLWLKNNKLARKWLHEAGNGSLELEKRLMGIQHTRNYCRLTHGLNTVKENRAREAVEDAEELLKESDYPLPPATVRLQSVSIFV